MRPSYKKLYWNYTDGDVSPNIDENVVIGSED
jgi:hypothetical protein